MIWRVSNIEKIKLEMIAPLSQVIIFHTNGEVIETCNTLIPVDIKRSIFDQFDFLKSIEQVFPSLPVAEKLVFDAVEWNEGSEGLMALEFMKLDSIRIQCIILDKTKDQEQITKVQQERNESAINEEFLEIQRKYLEMEKTLLDYRNEELQRVQKFKEQFFAEVSHEMRTPLNSISGLIDLLKSSQNQENNDYLQALKATSNHLNAIINDVLDLSKIEAGKFKLSSKAFDLSQSVARILAGFSQVASQKEVGLNVDIDPQLPELVAGDEVRLSQILYNLLGNALKFTAEGSVKMTIAVNESNSTAHQLHFQIRDTGNGMSHEDIRRILEPYAQVEGQDYHQFGGTGLGLGIAQQLIQLMGGSLLIESQLGQGTSMSFDITFGVGDREVASVDNDFPDLSHLSVLFVEDDEMAVVLLKGLVNKTKINARFASTIVGFQNEITETKFDYIVSDINLPDGNMIATVEGLRGAKGLNQNAFVIFLSGDDREAHPDLDKNANHSFLLKPIATADLIKELSNKREQIAINLDNLRASTQGDLGLMKELIETIVKTLPLELKKLESHVAKDEKEEAKKVLHKINPSIKYLGVKELIDARQALYDRLQADKNIATDLPAFLTKVKQAIDALAVYEL